jgi:lantibiotic biosynthesis protein
LLKNRSHHIALAIWSASKVLNDIKLREIALDIFKHASNRRSRKDNLVNDASICHGAFGIAKIFHRIYKETNIEIFKISSEYWMSEGLEMANRQEGFAGFMQFEPNEFRENEWKKYLNLLVGISGIGLVIIDYLADFDTKWDECLMIN